MSLYSPDKFLIIKMTSDLETTFKVFGSWVGGYLSGDSWRMNSGISEVVKQDNAYYLHGYSGSVYMIKPEQEGTTGYTAGIVADLLEQAKGYKYDVSLVTWEQFLREWELNNGKS